MQNISKNFNKINTNEFIADLEDDGPTFTEIKL